MMETVFSQSRPIDADEVRGTGCFTSLPVRIHDRDDISNAASMALIRDWGDVMQDGREKISHCSLCDRGNWCSFIFPESYPERLGLLTYLADIGMMHDDACEELTVEDATAEHGDLDAALDLNDGRTLNKESKSSKTKKLASQVLLECVKLDQEQSVVMLESYRKAWLAIMEHANTDHIQTLDEFFYHRARNGGMDAYWAKFNFSMSMLLTKEEDALLADVRFSAERALLLTNDYWSWEREREQGESHGEGRIFNAVWFIMKQDGVSAEAGQEKVKSMILSLESDFVEHKAKLYRENPSLPAHLRLWAEACGIVVSGNNYWCANCPRQRKWKSKPPPAPKERVRLSQLSAMGRSGSKEAKHIEPYVNGTNGTNGTNSINGKNGTMSNGHAHHSSSMPLTNGGSPKESTSNFNDLQPTHNIKSSKRGRPASLTTPPDTPPNSQKTPKLDDTPVLAPCTYISSLPSKGFRSALMEALDIWLQVPGQTMQTVKRTIDMLHNSSLILDDIEDRTDLRRGKPAAHVLFGEAQAINSATFVYVRAVEMVHQLGSKEALEALLEEMQNLFIGQGWDLYWKHHLRVPSEEEYLQMVDLKTGGLFRLLARLMLAGSTASSTLPLASGGNSSWSSSAYKNGDDDDVNAVDFSALSRLMGRFFQIRDDYMNLASALYAQQKGFCEDLDEGKLSYLVVHCCAQSPLFRDHVMGMFRSSAANGSMSMEGKQYVLSCMEEAGSMRATRVLLAELERAIQQEIGKLEDRLGEENPVLRLLVASLSVKDEGLAT